VARLVVEKRIRATPDQVWAIIEDVESHGDWMVDVRKLEFKTVQRRGAGTVVMVHSELFGLPLLHDTMVITGWEPGKRLDVRHAGQFTGTGAFELESVPEGTLFRWVEEFRPPFGQLGELAFRYVVKPHLTRVFGRSLENLRRLAESTGVPGGQPGT
jgi:hypothetical protein